MTQNDKRTHSNSSLNTQEAWAILMRSKRCVTATICLFASERLESRCHQRRNRQAFDDWWALRENRPVKQLVSSATLVWWWAPLALFCQQASVSLWNPQVRLGPSVQQPLVVSFLSTTQAPTFSHKKVHHKDQLLALPHQQCASIFDTRFQTSTTGSTFNDLAT